MNGHGGALLMHDDNGRGGSYRYEGVRCPNPSATIFASTLRRSMNPRLEASA